MRRLLLLVVLISAPLWGAENLKLNSHLDYSSDSQDGPLITGDRMDDGTVTDKPNYIIFYGEGWFNSKRQARRSVSLYESYKGRVNFVVIDLDRKVPAPQQELVKKYFRGSIPHVVVLDRSGKAVYDTSGEVEENVIAATLDKALK